MLDFNKGNGSRYKESWVSPRITQGKTRKLRGGRWGIPLSFLASSIWNELVAGIEMRLTVTGERGEKTTKRIS